MDYDDHLKPPLSPVESASFLRFSLRLRKCYFSVNFAELRNLLQKWARKWASLFLSQYQGGRVWVTVKKAYPLNKNGGLKEQPFF